MNIFEQIQVWEENDAIDIMREIGFKEKDQVVDFGCSLGHYSIPLAQVVGQEGRVYGIDMNKESTHKLLQRSVLNNVEIHNEEIIDILPFKDNGINGILFYDIIHELDIDHMIQESHRILKKNGILSILPFHLKHQQIEALSEKIFLSGFSYKSTLFNKGLHFTRFYHKDRVDDIESIEKGNILNFIKD